MALLSQIVGFIALILVIIDKFIEIVKYNIL